MEHADSFEEHDPAEPGERVLLGPGWLIGRYELRDLTQTVVVGQDGTAIQGSFERFAEVVNGLIGPCIRVQVRFDDLAIRIDAPRRSETLGTTSDVRGGLARRRLSAPIRFRGLVLGEIRCDLEEGGPEDREAELAEWLAVHASLLLENAALVDLTRWDSVSQMSRRPGSRRVSCSRTRRARRVRRSND